MAEIRGDFVREREALHTTLAELGPDKPTSCGEWTTGDLAVHVATGEVAAGLPSSAFRLLVARGIRIDWMAPVNRRALDTYRRRRGFDWAMRRLSQPPPRAHLSRAIAPVALFEVWAHHEDVVDANDLGGCSTGIDLGPVVRMLIRYQRRPLRKHEIPQGTDEDVARWLAGRTPDDLGLHV